MNNNIEIIKEIPAIISGNTVIPQKLLVKCFCGKEYEVNPHTFKYHGSKGCGCARSESRKAARKKQAPPNFKHGQSKTPIYTVYHSMIRRCYEPHNKAYKYYGGRGITVCDEWKNDFNAFYNWVTKSDYIHGLQIDRIDNNGNYSPDNCRFVSAKKNAQNTRSNLLIEYNKETKTLSEWSEILNISYRVLYKRLFVWGINPEYAFSNKIFSLREKKSKMINQIALEIKEKLKTEGRKQRWLVEKLIENGIEMSDTKISNKLNGADFFTETEVIAVNSILGTDYKIVSG